MARDDLLGQMGRQMLWSTTLFLEHGDIETLCALGVLLPPKAQGRHVVSRESSYAAIGITIEMGKLIATLLGHRLNLEGKNAEVVEHRSHTIGQHTQILSTTKHTRRAKHFRESVHRLIAPEEVVALVIVVVVEAHESILILSRERFEHRFVDDPDARMVHLRLLGILQEEYTTNQTIETITNPKTILIAPTLEGIAHFLLGVVLSFQVVEPIGTRNQEVFSDIRGVHAKQPIEHAVVDEGFGKEVFAERQTEVFYLAHRHG